MDLHKMSWMRESGSGAEGAQALRCSDLYLLEILKDLQSL